MSLAPTDSMLSTSSFTKVLTSDLLQFLRLTICLENEEILGNFTAVRENSPKTFLKIASVAFLVSLASYCMPVILCCSLLSYACLCFIVYKRSSICIAHRRKHASNVLSSLTRAACRTATVCSLQTQVGAAAG